MAPSRKRVKGQLTEEVKKEEIDEEKTIFSFAPKGLNSKQCLKRFLEFQTFDDFKEAVPEGEHSKFLTRTIKAQNPLKCMQCPKTFTSSPGLLSHLRKCVSSEERPASRRGRGVKNEDYSSYSYEEFQNEPTIWLRIPNELRISMIDQICVEDYVCFGENCGQSFSSAKEIVAHLKKCVLAEYYSYKEKPEEFRKLDKKRRAQLIREAIQSNNGSANCLLCDRSFAHNYGLAYHLERCQLEESEKPWVCYRCKFSGTAADSERHLQECREKSSEPREAKRRATRSIAVEIGDEDKPTNYTETHSPTKLKGEGARRKKERSDGSVTMLYRKSAVNRGDSNAIVNLLDQQRYEDETKRRYEEWRESTSKIELCPRLAELEKVEWERTPLEASDPLKKILKRKSLTLNAGRFTSLEGIKEVPEGKNIECLKSLAIPKNEDENVTVAYCGAPINNVTVAPNRLSTGEDVICVTTFPSENEFDSDSSIVQFWRHKYEEESNSDSMKPWFLLHLPEKGVVLSAKWLQLARPEKSGIVGYIGLATTLGKILIYRIDETSVSLDEENETENSGNNDEIQVIVAEPHLMLEQPKADLTLSELIKSDNDTEEEEEEDNNNEVQNFEKIGDIPIFKFDWCEENGGNRVVALNACGDILVWDMNESLKEPKINVDPSWASPPWDVTFMDYENVAVTFREKIVRVININTWHCRLSDTTMKSAGVRLHSDRRCFEDFFVFQPDYSSHPMPNCQTTSYFTLEGSTGNYGILPLANTHQLMTCDMGICAYRGIVLTCGTDGRLLASASGKIVLRGGDYRTLYGAYNHLMLLTRRKIESEDLDLTAPIELKGGENEPEKKLEESCYEHEMVCKNMWLDVEFGVKEMHNKLQLSCRDQRIESLNCVDSNEDLKRPVAFVGGEAGLLFVVPCALKIQQTIKKETIKYVEDGKKD